MDSKMLIFSYLFFDYIEAGEGAHKFSSLD